MTAACGGAWSGTGRRYARKEERIARWRAALKRIRTVRTAEARAIAEQALADEPPEE